MSEDGEHRYLTQGGIEVTVSRSPIEADAAIEELIDRLDSEKGLLLSSSYEYPGRYTRWDMGFVNPPLSITSSNDFVEVRALNARGKIFLDVIYNAVTKVVGAIQVTQSEDTVSCRIEQVSHRFEEEERSRQPSTFSVVRSIVELFAGVDPHLGLYGAFGYDLAFQFEPMEMSLERPADQRDLLLYIPDELIVVDHQGAVAERVSYEFAIGGRETILFERAGELAPYLADKSFVSYRDHAPGSYANAVELARDYFARGDLFEVVSSQTFSEPSPEPPSELFRRLKEQNPSPYGFLINLGKNEWLVGASPEMYVRVEGDRVETCPISGTIARGQDPLDDASQILALLNSSKDESELTMCTDVDRNDKSRICVPGSVKVIGRRQIEMYSRLIHTGDQVGQNCRVLVVDHRDSFVHTLTNYLKQTGASVTTLRSGVHLEEIDRSKTDLLVLSPGPGRPEDFRISETIELAVAEGIPIFGVCLGLQAIVEYYGGVLDQLVSPMHGKPSLIETFDSRIFTGLPESFRAGRYHSLFAKLDKIPDELKVVAVSADDGVAMAVEHKELPIAAVQFHPESIMSLDDNVGIELVHGVIRNLTKRNS